MGASSTNGVSKNRGFLFAFHSNYGSILHHFGDKARYWSKIVIFFIPPCILRPRYGGPVGRLPSGLVWKTRMIGQPDGVKSLTIQLPVSTQSTNVTDTQTDRRTDDTA